MTMRTNTGWQYGLADLSLILFMVMASAVSAERPPLAPPRAEAVAVWRAGGPALTDWIAAQPVDPRQQLTIVAPVDAAQAAIALARSSPRPARIILDPVMTGAPYATLAYDARPTENVP